MQDPILDRNSPMPLYYQLERSLELEISSGRWVPGDQIGSEPDLMNQFGVSRSVIRQALKRLEQRGLITRQRGRGSYVANEQLRSWLLASQSGFFQDEVDRAGRLVRTDVLRAEIELLPDWALRALELPPGALGVVLERLRYVDAELTLYDSNYLPEELAESVVSLTTDPQGSLYELLRRNHGLEVGGGRRVVSAVIAGTYLAKVLGVSRAAPLLVVEGIDWTADLRRFDCYRTWLRPERMKIEVDVVGNTQRPGDATFG